MYILLPLSLIFAVVLVSQGVVQTFKGYETVVVQDLVLRTDTIAFEQEIWYSPSERRSYRARWLGARRNNPAAYRFMWPSVRPSE